MGVSAEKGWLIEHICNLYWFLQASLSLLWSFEKYSKRRGAKRRGQITSPGSSEHFCWRKLQQDYKDYERTADLDDQELIKAPGNVWNNFAFKYVLLVSFFWLVGVVAQLTLTSCKRESCREQEKKSWDPKLDPQNRGRFFFFDQRLRSHTRFT